MDSGRTGKSIADILNLDEFRELRGVTVDITFVSVRLDLREGGSRTISVTRRSVPTELMDSAIEEVRRNDGFVHYEGDVAWFIPWPPAAIRVSPAQTS